jgi:hypothetical protein
MRRQSRACLTNQYGMKRMHGACLVEPGQALDGAVASEQDFTCCTFPDCECARKQVCAGCLGVVTAAAQASVWFTLYRICIKHLLHEQGYCLPGLMRFQITMLRCVAVMVP